MAAAPGRRRAAGLGGRARLASSFRPIDPACIFSEGGEVMKLHIEGFLTIPIPGIKIV